MEMFTSVIESQSYSLTLYMISSYFNAQFIG